MKPTYLSKRGFKELQKQIKQLETESRTILNKLREIGRAKSRDDKIHRSNLISSLEITESKLTTKRLILKNARPMPRKRDRLRVAIGSVVDLIDQQGRLFRYTLVESLEADPSDGRISVESPLGQALLNRQKNELVSLGEGRKIRQLALVNVQ